MSAYRALIVEEREDRVVVKLHRPGRRPLSTRASLR